MGSIAAHNVAEGPVEDPAVPNEGYGEYFGVNRNVRVAQRERVAEPEVRPVLGK